MEDDEIIKLSNFKTTISSVGQGAVGLLEGNGYGVSLYYQVTEDVVKLLIEKNIVKYRVHIGEGRFDSEIKPKKAEIIKKSASLILNLEVSEIDDADDF